MKVELTKYLLKRDKYLGLNSVQAEELAKIFIKFLKTNSKKKKGK